MCSMAPTKSGMVIYSHAVWLAYAAVERKIMSCDIRIKYNFLTLQADGYI